MTVTAQTPPPAWLSAPVPARPARHGRNTAEALAQPWRCLSAGYVRLLRAHAERAPRANRKRLPRWHQNSAYRPLSVGQYAENGASWVWEYDRQTGRRQPVQKGSTGRVAWTSRDRFLTTVLGLVLAEAGARDVLKAYRVDADTFRRWVRYESLYADQSTGRRVIVRAVTVAALMEVDKRTVQRCRAAGRALGLYVTLMPGRMLNVEEQTACRFRGSPQRGLANESAFVVPKHLARRGVVSCLHRGTRTGETSAYRNPVLALNTEGEKEPTSSARHLKRRRRASAGWKLAVQVVNRLPFARGADPRDFAALLHRFATAGHVWTADDVVRHVDRTNARKGWTSIADPADLKAPAFALLAKYLRDVEPVNDHPRMDLFLAEERRVAELERAEARRAEAAAAVALETSSAAADWRTARQALTTSVHSK